MCVSFLHIQLKIMCYLDAKNLNYVNFEEDPLYENTEYAFSIEALHVTYYTIIWRTALVHSKEVWLQSIITGCPQYNKCSGIKSVNNNILLNRLHTAMITVLNTGSNLLFGVNRWKGAGPLWEAVMPSQPCPALIPK